MKFSFAHSITAAALAALCATPALANVPDAGLAEVQELVKAGRGADALRRLEALIAKNPDDPQLRFQKGIVLVDQRRSAEAISVFERMSRDFPTLPEPLNNLAVLYAEQGQIEKARAALEAAVRSRPSYDTAYENLSSVNVRLASRAYARALQIDDSGGAPKLALLKSLAGSRADAVPVVVATTSPPAPASPASAAAPGSASSSTASAPQAVAAAPVAPPPRPEPPSRPDTPSKSAPPDGTAVAIASKSMPSTSNGSQRHGNDEARDVQAAVAAWATAWERKDMNAYVGAYVPGYKGSDSSASRWQDGRRQRIVGKTRISLELSGVTVELLPGDVAKVSFRQDYSADQFTASTRKVLELVKRNGRWLINKESVGS